MKEFDRLMLMNSSSVSESSFSSKQLSDNEDKPDLQQVLISEACICRMLRMRINKLKNERHQNLNHERNFSITKMLLKLQQQRNQMMGNEKCMCLNVKPWLMLNIHVHTLTILLICTYFRFIPK